MCGQCMEWYDGCLSDIYRLARPVRPARPPVPLARAVRPARSTAPPARRPPRFACSLHTRQHTRTLVFAVPDVRGGYVRERSVNSWPTVRTERSNRTNGRDGRALRRNKLMGCVELLGGRARCSRSAEPGRVRTTDALGPSMEACTRYGLGWDGGRSASCIRRSFRVGRGSSFGSRTYVRTRKSLNGRMN